MLALVLVCSSLVCIPIPASAESMYIRKVVSVVYDDSGSMKEDDWAKWGYASYAMQAFCGMLNSEDQLYITYMSEAEKNPNLDPRRITLTRDGIQNEVNAIRDRTTSGSTPWQAVEIAYKKLLSVQDNNPNTQYWLVVITDGDFDKFEGMAETKKQGWLDEKFAGFAGGVMPNGTHPQITYLAIGKKIFAPKENTDLGITPYRANSATDITDRMGAMADRVSGRTRLTGSDLKKIDDKTIEVYPSIPLMNIAVIANSTDAVVTGVTRNGEGGTDIVRKALISYPKFEGLNGSAFLLGKTGGGVIGSGTYRITFDKAVDLKNIAVLYEPALEVRMSVSVNGQEITDFSELQNAKSRDKVKVSCKLYEMDSDNTIDLSVLPPNTKYHLAIMEDGKVVRESSGKEMELEEHELQHVLTELRGEVTIPGFSPITYQVDFTPIEYVEYGVSAEYGNDVQSVKFDEIAQNEDLKLVFRFTANGEPITDVEAVKALAPEVTVSPAGNAGTTEFTDDGALVFTPNEASMSSNGRSDYEAEVTCTLASGESAVIGYSVLMEHYAFGVVGAGGKTPKHTLHENAVGVSFAITKENGAQLSKAEVEQGIEVGFDPIHENFIAETAVGDDGVITITPKNPNVYTGLGDGWLWYWKHYFFDIPSEDITVTLNHPLGSATGTVDVVGAPIGFQLLKVWLPMALELFLLLLLANYLFCVFKKPKFAKGAKLYVGRLRYDSLNGTHILRDFTCINLEKYNSIKRGNGRLKFKLKADTVHAGGIKLRADYAGRVICEELFPWYRGVITPHEYDDAHIDTPLEVQKHFTVARNRALVIEEFAPTDTIEDNGDRTLYSASARRPRFLVVADGGLKEVDGHKVIQTGKIFIYTNV